MVNDKPAASFLKDYPDPTDPTVTMTLKKSWWKMNFLVVLVQTEESVNSIIYHPMHHNTLSIDVTAEPDPNGKWDRSNSGILYTEARGIKDCLRQFLPIRFIKLLVNLQPVSCPGDERCKLNLNSKENQHDLFCYRNYSDCNQHSDVPFSAAPEEPSTLTVMGTVRL